MLSKPKLRSKKWYSSTYPGNELNADVSKYASAEYFAKNIVGTVYFDEACRHVPADAIVVEIGPHGLLQAILKRSLSKDVTNISLTDKRHEDNAVRLLAAVGELFEAGLCPQILKIYPPIEFPVSRGTPSISPLVRWDHSHNWFVSSDEDAHLIKQGRRTVVVTLEDDEHKYLVGHIIRGKNLYPGSGYLVLAWETFCQMNNKEMRQLPVKLTDVRFIRATTLSKDDVVRFDVTVFKNSGGFEISEQGELVAAGKICILEEDSGSVPSSSDDDDHVQDVEFLLNENEFYDICTQIGFYFDGLFRSIKRINYERTVAQISWCNNYVVFLDGIMQMLRYLTSGEEKSTRIPVSLKTITINPRRHENLLKTLDARNPEFTAFCSLDLGDVRCGGITMENLELGSFSTGKLRQKCVMEKFEFVPYMCSVPSFTLNDIVRMCVQIIVENTQTNKMKIVEMLTNDSLRGPLICPLINEIVEDLPSVKAELVVNADNGHPLVAQQSTKCFRVEGHDLVPDTSCTLIVAVGALQRKKAFANYANALCDEGFILSRENTAPPCLSDEMEFVVCSEFKLEDENLVLLRKKSRTTWETVSVKITNKSVDWLRSLQECLRTMSANQKLILYAENEPSSGILGFYNGLKKEQPHLNLCCFYMMDENGQPFEEQNNSFYLRQLQKNLKVNVYKNGCWGSYRHLPLTEADIEPCQHKYMNLRTYGDLSSLGWFGDSTNPQKYTTLDEDKCLVYVEYAALNFRDIMIATGKMDPTSIFKRLSDQDCMIGFEFAGRLQDGRRVMGTTESKAIANFVEIDRKHVWPVPDEWTMEEAATVPVVYGTVLYALFSCGPLRRGSSILIHCGAGGIGIAAITICQCYGCEIFTTVGSAKKREFIKAHFPNIPDNHIGTSRDCSFEKMIKYTTNGEGVDLVLNSLSEEKLEASVRCLKPGGRFMEIGKYDLIVNNKLEMKPFLKGITFQTLDLTNILRNQGTLSTLDSMMNEALKDGTIKPLPYTLFNADDAEEAFRFMALGKHIGKIILKIQKNCQLYEPAKLISNFYPHFTCSPHKSYILCGGLGGLGIELADWLVNRGACKLILTSRRGMTTGYQRWRVQNWRLRNINVTIATGDISNECYIRQLLQQANSIGPVSGIFNLAAVLDEKSFENQTSENFIKSDQPKGVATALLDRLSREMCPELDHFVVYSSVACGFGTFGQTNYAMGNSIVERICEMRKKDNLPALAIEFGPIDGVGMFMKTLNRLRENRDKVVGLEAAVQVFGSENSNQTESIGQYSGCERQRIESYLAVHDYFLRQTNPIVLSMVIGEKNLASKKNRSLSDTIAHILGIVNAQSINPNATLSQLGMDSMTNSEIRQILREEWGLTVTLREVATLTFTKLDEMEDLFLKKQVENYVGNNDSDIEISDFMIHFCNVLSARDLKLLENIVEYPSKLSNVASIESTPKLFVCPGMIGIAAAWEKFASKLEARIFIFQYRYVHPDTSISQIAHTLLPEIKARLPIHEPFYIVGSSFGVFVAMYLVKLLEKEGHSGVVWMLDSDLGFLYSNDKNLHLEQIGRFDAAKAVTRGMKTFFSRHRNEFPDKLLAESESETDEFLDVLTRDIEEQVTYFDTKIRSTLIGRVPPVYAVWGVRMLALVLDEKPANASIKSSAILIRTPKKPFEISDDQGISKYFAETLKIYFVQANHFTIHEKDETIEIIAREMKASWEQYLSITMKPRNGF